MWMTKYIWEIFLIYMLQNLIYVRNISHIYLIFTYSSWPIAAKTLGISRAMRAMGTSFVRIFGLFGSRKCYRAIKMKWCFVIHNQPLSITTRFVNEIIFGNSLTLGGVHWLPRELTWVFSSTLWFWGRGEELGVDSITSGQWFSQSCLCNDLHKNPKGRIRELLYWLTRTLPWATMPGP